MNKRKTAVQFNYYTIQRNKKNTASMNDNLLIAEGGPPDPITYLRRVSGADSGDSVSDDASNGGGVEGAETDEPTKKKVRRNSSRRVQDPPARERPAEGQAWPYRDTLSFTRALIFYGAGAVTHEHERACKSIEECRKLRQK